MPIQIYADVNGKSVQTYHIAGMEKYVDDRKWCDYQIVCVGPNTQRDGAYHGPTYRQWDDEGIIFQHRRKDGMNMLIARAMTALEENFENI